MIIYLEKHMKQIRKFCKEFDSIIQAEMIYKIEAWKRSKKTVDNQIDANNILNLEYIHPEFREDMVSINETLQNNKIEKKQIK